MNFDELVAQSEAVRRRRQEREARQAAMMQQRLRDVKQEMNGQHWNVMINHSHSQLCTKAAAGNGISSTLSVWCC